MQNILIVCTGAPYGSESLYNALRLAIALKEQEECAVDLRLFLLSDAVTVALNGQAPTEGYNLRQMLEILSAQHVPMRLCKTAATAEASVVCRSSTASRSAPCRCWPAGPSKPTR